MAKSKGKYPFKKYNFEFDVKGINVGAFSEVSGVDTTIDVIEYRVGTEMINSPRKMPGLTKVANITCKWGMCSDMDFANWCMNISTGQHITSEESSTTEVAELVTIRLMDDTNENVLAQWELVNAWPCKYTGSDMNASSSEVAFESIELACEEIRRATGT